MAKQKSSEMLCPSCGRVLVNFAPHPERSGRTLGYCVCNSIGAVIEFNDQAPPYDESAPETEKSYPQREY